MFVDLNIFVRSFMMMMMHHDGGAAGHPGLAGLAGLMCTCIIVMVDVS